MAMNKAALKSELKPEIISNLNVLDPLSDQNAMDVRDRIADAIAQAIADKVIDHIIANAVVTVPLTTAVTGTCAVSLTTGLGTIDGAGAGNAQGTIT